MRRIGWFALLALIVPVLASTGCALFNRPDDWRNARRDSSGQAPDPLTTPEAVVQVYAARTVGWKGALGVHTWVVVKPSHAKRYTRYEVIGWGVMRGYPAIQVDRTGPDNYWFGAAPQKLAERRGPGVDAMIRRIEEAIKTYPYPDSYRTWPGPNSNTFIAHIARAVPELRLDLPPTAIGKDFLANDAIAAAAPSGTGYQLSLYGLFGVLGALEEGIELNMLGLSFGLDFNTPGIRLPGMGRIGLPQ
ncbi:MAG: DUF3750 domain-containing protein [Burkholderiales bacterium]|nr:DUF3750 domain-containing protein [Burkholderiales bacterium]